MQISNIYEITRARGLTTSARHFSQNLLGRSPNYMAAARGRCSRDTLVILHHRLGEMHQPDLQAEVLAHLLGKAVPQQQEDQP